MYSNVPRIAPNSVNIVRSVSRCSTALATPKSMTLGSGTPSCSVTSTFEGLMSRWMMPFWWACWIARQTPASKFSARSTLPRSSAPFENSPANSSTRSSRRSIGTERSSAADRVITFSSAGSKWPSKRLASGLPMTSSNAATFSAPLSGRWDVSYVASMVMR